MENNYPFPEPTVDLQPVDRGVRFLNYLIDLVVFYLLFLGGGMVLGVALYASGGESANSFLSGLENIPPILDRLLTLVLYGLFMFVQEAILGGRSLGKLITQTRVLTSEGDKPDTGTLLTRNLSRCVPFEQLSFFGERGWHDAWSDTIVVKAKP